MYKLVLKVEECKKNESGYKFTCKDRFDFKYYFDSKCFKKVDTYILVTFNRYNAVAGDLELAEQILISDIKYINDLEIANNKLTLNNKSVASDVLEDVKNFITKHSIEELNRLIDKCDYDYTYSDHIKEMDRCEKNKNNYMKKLKRLKNYLKVV